MVVEMAARTNDDDDDDINKVQEGKKRKFRH